MTRKEEREQAFCLVFEKGFRDESCAELLELAESIRDFELTPYITETFCGVFDQLETVDSIIAKHLEKWTIDRIPKADLALLRLAVYEMKYNDTVPVGVTVNEIIDLAKIYSGEKDPAYINGVLGGISRSGALD